MAPEPSQEQLAALKIQGAAPLDLLGQGTKQGSKGTRWHRSTSSSFCVAFLWSQCLCLSEYSMNPMLAYAIALRTSFRTCP